MVFEPSLLFLNNNSEIKFLLFNQFFTNFWSNIIFEKIDKNKEELKTNIQKTFTRLRNVLNEREDELLN